ncbi:putative ferulic acid Esterase/Feruloyl esterase [Lasiodiplodia theobromae]|uniref:Carboxylic ester hydrolase n=1 Tax=Lasiodiplodia theobromae TaxID=45133 RepID=A0A5N5DKL5_9PEZI|nr:putative feruloyl esterase B-1 [Lasiodiplodia theobromae]KAF9637841.1 putative ferulic acid Esterase/Feruloyl esterase [Lasiodiplodia theobromae]
MRAASVVLAAASALGVQAFNCSSAALQSALPSNATVLSAVPVAGNGTYGQGAADPAYPTNPTNLPALCAVYVNVTSSSSSSFRFGLFLPTEWNERFLAVGNGGFAGGVNWLDMGAGVGYGFAVVSTDTGHNSTSGELEWALDAPEVLNDWGYRAMHGSVELGKKLATAYYSSEIKYSYYTGCSTGGRQGIRDIQLYPEDFDGVLAGAPAWWTTHMQTWTAKMGTFNLPLNGSHRIDPALFPVIEAEVVKQCDPQDGLADNIVSDPLACNFNADALLCTPTSNSSACLTPAQLDTLSKIYGAYIDTNDTFVFPGLALSSESQWQVLLGTPTGEPLSYGIDYVRYFLSQPDFRWEDFTYAVVERADELDPGNATADAFAAMADYRARGGKLLHYHGWSDGLIATGSSLHFYQQVARALLPMGIPLDDWYRFFLVPGMQHCSATPSGVDAPWYFAGGNQAGDFGTGVHGVPGFEDGKHDALLALMDWVENGTVVDEIIATKFVDEDVTKGVERQRPLCMYPKQAVYKGEGDVDAAESWECKSLY